MFIPNREKAKMLEMLQNGKFAVISDSIHLKIS